MVYLGSQKAAQNVSAGFGDSDVGDNVDDFMMATVLRFFGTIFTLMTFSM